MTSENRVLTRVSYSAHAQIRSTKRQFSIRAKVRDISLESIYLYCKSGGFTFGERVEIQITLLGRGSELIIKTTGSIYRVEKQGVSITFYHKLEWWPIFTYFPLNQLDSNPVTFTKGIE